jgi:hypothetical protein
MVYLGHELWGRNSFRLVGGRAGGLLLLGGFDPGLLVAGVHPLHVLLQLVLALELLAAVVAAEFSDVGMSKRYNKKSLSNG